MREHLKEYFPDRFEKTETLSQKAFDLFTGSSKIKNKTFCEHKVLQVFENAPEIKLMVGAMKKYGCNFSLPRHIVCEECYHCTGGFDPDTNQIVVCENIGLSKKTILQNMMHELIHMFDYCRAKMDFNNLEHVACSEIRATNLTACSISDRITHPDSGIFEWKQAHRNCVQKYAFQSLKSYAAGTDDEELWKIMDKVFPTCYNDLEPFGRRPLTRSDFRQSYRERYRYGYA